MVGVGAELAGDGATASAAQQAQGGIAEQRHDGGAGAGMGQAMVLAEGDILRIVQPILNGLIANDKICVVRRVLPTFDDPNAAFRERQHTLLAVDDNLATATTRRG